MVLIRWASRVCCYLAVRQSPSALLPPGKLAIPPELCLAAAVLLRQDQRKGTAPPGHQGEGMVMTEKKTARVQYGVKMFVYIGAALAILASIVAITLKLSAGTTSGLFYSYSTIAIAVLLIIFVRSSPQAK